MSFRRDYGRPWTDAAARRAARARAFEAAGWIFVYLVMVFALGMALFWLQDYGRAASAEAERQEPAAVCLQRPRPITPACEPGAEDE
ncbi:MAG TPA: hypothetical protein VK973_05905 [Arenicellales bacterium]|nr:hypothetical protein [Arenicellales bacterium]